jgi:transposase
VIIGAVMRKLVHIIYGVLKHQTPYDPAKVLGPSATTT